MTFIDPNDCSQSDCHLKCCLAKTCGICGNSRKINGDWRPSVILSSLFLFGTFMFFGLTLGMNTTLDGQFREGTSLQANLAFFIVVGLIVIAVASVFLRYTYKKAKKYSAVDKCSLKPCPANLKHRSCTTCGHPPNLNPFFFIYFALFTAVPTASAGLFIYCNWGSPLRTGFFIFCCLVSGIAVLIPLIAWTAKR